MSSVYTMYKEVARVEEATRVYKLVSVVSGNIIKTYSKSKKSYRKVIQDCHEMNRKYKAVMNKQVQANCKGCGKKFVQTSNARLFCSNSCKKTHYYFEALKYEEECTG